MTKLGIKTEDYREITPYWSNRLLLYNGENKNINWWKFQFFEVDDLPYYPAANLKENINLFCSIKNFDINVMTLGYPKSGNTERTLKLEHKGIEIRTGNPEWGAEPDKLYFVIKHV
jgi:hypothetical protein